MKESNVECDVKEEMGCERVKLLKMWKKLKIEEL